MLRGAGKENQWQPSCIREVRAHGQWKTEVVRNPCQSREELHQNFLGYLKNEIPGYAVRDVVNLH